MTGGIVVFAGFMLSPLSWWNDLFVNVPLALVFARAVGLFYKPASDAGSPAFKVSALTGYWLTNVPGFVLLHQSGEKLFSKENKLYSHRARLRDVVQLAALHRVDRRAGQIWHSQTD